MTWAGIVCILSSFEIFAVVIMAGGTRRLFGSASISETVFIAFTLALFPLGIVLMILGAWRFRKVKKKAKVGLLQEGETKRNPGLAIVLSFFYCGLGQLYNGQILKGILYMFFYGLFWYAVIWSQSIPRESIMDFWFRLYLFVLPIIFWVRGMTDAGRTARRINTQLDHLVETLDSQSLKTDLGKRAANLCVSCWLSGDCERERKAIKKKEMITDCRGYFIENE